MARILTDTHSDPASDKQNEIMVSSYLGANNKLVLVAINYGTTDNTLQIDLKNANKDYKKLLRYLTTDAADVNMKPELLKGIKSPIALPARSISTIVMN